MTEILEAKRKREEELLELDNVVSVGVGKKEIGGMETDEDAVIVGVKEKVPEDELADDQIVPKELGNGTKTDVQEVGVITAPPPEEEGVIDKIKDFFTSLAKKSRKDKWRPFPCGVSVAHKDVTAGTSGFILVDDEGNEYPSSNCHVYAASNKGEKGDPILQPGPYDGGKLPDDKCGELAGYVKLEDGCKVDVAWINASVEYENKLLGIGVPNAPPRKVSVGDKVVKSGRTTGVTRGKVKQVDATVKVRYPDPIGVIKRKKSVVTTKMLEGGDSGDGCAYVDGNKIHPDLTGYAGSPRISVFDQVKIVEEVTGMSVETEGGPPSPPNVAYIELALEKKRKGNGRIKVYVKEKGSGDPGTPIEDAKVTIEGPVERSKRTDKDGGVIFYEVPAPAKYKVKATKKGYKPDSGVITEDDWTGTPGE